SHVSGSPGPVLRRRPSSSARPERWHRDEAGGHIRLRLEAACRLDRRATPCSRRSGGLAGTYGRVVVPPAAPRLEPGRIRQSLTPGHTQRAPEHTLRGPSLSLAELSSPPEREPPPNQEVTGWAARLVHPPGTVPAYVADTI